MSLFLLCLYIGGLLGILLSRIFEGLAIFERKSNFLLWLFYPFYFCWIIFWLYIYPFIMRLLPNYKK